MVFTTAYEEYAAKAFELGAADYLLKPISRARLEKALARAWDRKVAAGAVQERAVMAPKARDSRTLKYVTARRGHKMILVAVEDIAYLSVEGEMVHVFTNEDSYLALAPSLDQLEKGLAGRQLLPHPPALPGQPAVRGRGGADVQSHVRAGHEGRPPEPGAGQPPQGRGAAGICWGSRETTTDEEGTMSYQFVEVGSEGGVGRLTSPTGRTTC